MSVRRLASLLLSVTLLAWGLTLAPSPARADVLASMVADVELSWSTAPSGGACTVTSTGVLNTNTPVAPDGLSHTASLTATVTATQTAGNTMTATVTETRTVTATAVDGQLVHVVVQDAWAASFQAQGSGASCHLRLLFHGDTAGLFTRAQPAWVTVTASGNGVLESASVSNDGDPVPGSDVASVAASGGGSTGSTGSGQGLLPVQPTGGHLVVFPSQEAKVWAPDAGTPTSSRQGSGLVDIRLDVPGSASGVASGSGKKYVDLGAAEDCSAHTATATWKPKAGKGKASHVLKATFKVGKATVGKARKPTRKRVTTLKGLPATGPVEVVGTLRLATGKTVTVTRTYLPCG